MVAYLKQVTKTLGNFVNIDIVQYIGRVFSI